MTKPYIRDLFVNAQKRLEVRFHTSSIEKYIQARLVFHQSGMTLLHFKESQDPYHEDYDLDQKSLLKHAIEEIKKRLGVNSLFFVEDTSVKVDALSSDEFVVPGLKVKEWFLETSFKELDVILKQRGNNRNATVYSDIALYLPRLNRPVFFHGETNGKIAETPPTFKKSYLHPWLSPDTFNGWFVPNGAKKRLGEMSFEESLEHDFRVKSLMSLIDKIEEYAAILNLKGHSYTVKRQRTFDINPRLFKNKTTLKVVIGRVCAGKTTLGEWTSHRHSYLFIEASKIMRLLSQEADIDADSPFYQARELLIKMGPDIVARQIVSMHGNDLDKGAIITGFRTIEEVQYIRSQFPDCKVVFIDASERTRFERHLTRGRIKQVITLRDFQDSDRQQQSFGLLQVACDIADIKIENEGTIEHFIDQIDALVEGNYEKVTGISDIEARKRDFKETRIFRCLRALKNIDRPALCLEIAQLTERDRPTANSKHVERISERHVNWVLKDFPELVRRIKTKNNKIQYEILPAGRAYLKAILSMQKAHIMTSKIS